MPLGGAGQIEDFVGTGFPCEDPTKTCGDGGMHYKALINRPRAVLYIREWDQVTESARASRFNLATKSDHPCLHDSTSLAVQLGCARYPVLRSQYLLMKQYQARANALSVYVHTNYLR